MKYRLFHHNFLNGDDALLIAGDDDAVQYIHLLTQGEKASPNWQQDNTAYQSIVDWLHAYLQDKNPPSPVAILGFPLFSGASVSNKNIIKHKDNVKYSIPSGTNFQQSCWSVIASIPYSQTISYTELATRAANPSAIRAAANACGKNPLPLLIPCHRIVGKSGNLGGFAWGLPYKQKLLALERLAGIGS